MSLHRIDPRFALSRPITNVLAFEGLEEWRVGFSSVGIETRGRWTTDIAPELAVAPARLAARALDSGADAILVEGNGRRALQRSGYHIQRLLLRPNRERPTLALPLDHPQAASYALERWSLLDRGWKRARMQAARVLMSRGPFPAWSLPLVTVATRTGRTPFLIAAAHELGVPSDAGWFLALGQGDALSRNVFHLFPPSSSTPTWILKFARVPGYSDPFDRVEDGLRMADEAGGAVALRTPRLLGRFEMGGIRASVESAAVGRRLWALLLTPGGARRS
jgi:hypothetical protein